MRMQLRGVLGLALAGVMAGACASGTRGSGEREEFAGPESVVRVTNNNWLDVTIYAVRSGQRARLGTVTSMSTETFRLPRTMVAHGTVQLMAAPIGSPRAHRTDPIVVGGGERIDLSIENALSLSTYRVSHAATR